MTRPLIFTASIPVDTGMLAVFTGMLAVFTGMLAVFGTNVGGFLAFL